MKKGLRLLPVLFILISSQNPLLAQDLAPGENPIFRNMFTADPAPMVYKDTLFVYAGHDEAGEGQMFNITEWIAYSTTDVKHWTSHGPVLKPTDFKWAVSDAWASQVIEKDGKFYFYTTVQHGPPHEGKAVGVAVGDHPLGPFKDAKGSALVYDSMTPTPEDPHDWDDIDPTVFTDDDGTSWLAWGNMHLYLARLKSNMTEFEGPIREIYLPNYTEGPWLHKRKNTYYLSYPCFAHQNMYEKICYATAPDITGPWTYRGIIMDRTEKSYTIHPGIIEYNDQWYFFYHTAQLNLNGQTGAIGRRAVSVEYLYYNSDGTIQPIRKTKEGVSLPPDPPNDYQSPIFHPDAPLVTVESAIDVTQHQGTAARNWGGTPVAQTNKNPYQENTTSESFNSADGVTSLGQTFRVKSDLELQQISLYAGDGFGTTRDEPVTLALYALDEGTGDDSVYTVGRNLLAGSDKMRINYEPQGRGILKMELAQSHRPLLKAGQTYVLEMQGVQDSAPLFWYRTQEDTYLDGAAYRNRMLIKQQSTTADFGMALYGSRP